MTAHAAPSGPAGPGEDDGTGAGEREAENGSQGAMDAAIEAAAEALSQKCAWYGWNVDLGHIATVALEAAGPILRQAAAEEIALRLRDAGLVGAVEIAREVGRG